MLELKNVLKENFHKNNKSYFENENWLQKQAYVRHFLSQKSIEQVIVRT